VGLVAPTAAEYRLLGVNEPLLATLRAATDGRRIASPADPWIHDLARTSSYTPLWPLLLIIALLLWPLDIALRRVSIGRRELVDARRAVVGWRRGRRAAPRTIEVAGMFSARDRAAGAAARAALLKVDDTAASAPAPSTPTTTSPRPDTAPRAPSHGPVPPTEPASASADSSVQPADSDTLARLREAKRRARGS
jgi:hypothetical protein